MLPGKTIFLNGTSSAGKTTLAHALQEHMPEPWLHIALDQYRDSMPARFRGLNAPEGTDGHRGLNVVPVVHAGQTVTEVRFGDMGRQMLQGMRRAIRALVLEGNNAIIDDIILMPEFLDDYLDAMTGLPVYFVGVMCPKVVVSAREASRPGRFPGTAIGHFDVCHAHGLYDVEVHTDQLMPEDCAGLVAEFVARQQPMAFPRLRDKRRSATMVQQQ
jgi:chloramphenicol 3-O phosphotransferase